MYPTSCVCDALCVCDQISFVVVIDDVDLFEEGFESVGAMANPAACNPHTPNSIAVHCAIARTSRIDSFERANSVRAAISSLDQPQSSSARPRICHRHCQHHQ